MDISEVARMGAEARNSRMSAEERSESARRAVTARWRAFYREHPEKRKGKRQKGKARK